MDREKEGETDEEVEVGKKKEKTKGKSEGRTEERSEVLPRAGERERRKASWVSIRRVRARCEDSSGLEAG